MTYNVIMNINNLLSADKTYVLGIALVIDALKYIPNEVIDVYLSSNAIQNKEYDKLINLCKDNNIKYITDDKVIDNLSNKENCYGVAIINKYERKLDNNRHIILDGFNDKGELGTIIRTMASFNYKNLVLVNSDIDIYDPMVIRSSMGGYFYVNKVKYDSLDDYLKEYNRSIIKIGLKGDKTIKKCCIDDKTSLLFNSNDNDYYIDHLENSALSISSIVGISLDLFKKL